MPRSTLDLIVTAQQSQRLANLRREGEAILDTVVGWIASVSTELTALDDRLRSLGLDDDEHQLVVGLVGADHLLKVATGITTAADSSGVSEDL